MSRSVPWKTLPHLTACWWGSQVHRTPTNICTTSQHPRTTHGVPNLPEETSPPAGKLWEEAEGNLTPGIKHRRNQSRGARQAEWCNAYTVGKLRGCRHAWVWKRYVCEGVQLRGVFASLFWLRVLLSRYRSNKQALHNVPNKPHSGQRYQTGVSTINIHRGLLEKIIKKK